MTDQPPDLNLPRFRYLDLAEIERREDELLKGAGGPERMTVEEFDLLSHRSAAKIASSDLGRRARHLTKVLGGDQESQLSFAAYVTLTIEQMLRNLSPGPAEPAPSPPRRTRRFRQQRNQDPRARHWDEPAP